MTRWCLFHLFHLSLQLMPMNVRSYTITIGGVSVADNAAQDADEQKESKSASENLEEYDHRLLPIMRVLVLRPVIRRGSSSSRGRGKSVSWKFPDVRTMDDV